MAGLVVGLAPLRAFAGGGARATQDLPSDW